MTTKQARHTRYRGLYVTEHVTALTTADGQPIPDSIQEEIRLKGDASPVQHAPRRVLVALRDRLKTFLDNMVKAHIITPVTDPTLWISLMVIIPK